MAHTTSSRVVNGPLIVQGIELIPTSQLPDRFRSIFPHPLFNAVQSKCFQTIYSSDDNFVLSSPTASGKTTILELAICRLVLVSPVKNFKVIYHAPTKSLCSERMRDWVPKFAHLGLSCVEATGDSDMYNLRDIQHANIVITTPEKWDSLTRKWKDHKKFMEYIKLFLIDEVHMLKEDRGASLEAIVSRMKSAGAGVRFIALSATIPNSEDVAAWLGKNERLQTVWASREVFGEDFRPVKLQKHVRGLQSNSNDYQFDHLCNEKLPETISRYGIRDKPTIVFCMTRKSAEAAAALLTQYWDAQTQQERLWDPPRRRLKLLDQKLTKYVMAGVAYHHAGAELEDRKTVEDAYLRGDVNVICCTSTLAVGLNLPCHLVIIKNTLSYQEGGIKELSDLEIMQMLGRAGRPQYDTSAVAVILTRSEKVAYYERMVSGQEVVESKLHENLIQHLNSEVCLGTVFNFETAKQWLKGTFLYVRLKANPQHYMLGGDTEGLTVDETLNQLCETSLSLLQQYSLSSSGSNFSATEFGVAMAKYFVKFETMKVFRGIPPKAKMSELLSAIAQAYEFKNIRLRSGEKQTYKDINSSPSIKFPIKVDLALGPHKVSLIIQAVLGGIDLRQDDRIKDKRQIQSDANLIFQHVYLQDSESVRNALELSRSLGAQAWDDSPLQLGQVEGIGPATIRKLVNAGVKTVEDLENTDWQKIDMILSRNPPFGANLLSKLSMFPKLRVSLKQLGHAVVQNEDGNCVRAKIGAEVGFLNDVPPKKFGGKNVEVTVLAETSSNHVLHFGRVKSSNIGKGINWDFLADLTSSQEIIHCSVACDQIAGTFCSAVLTPKVPELKFTSLATTNSKFPFSQSFPNNRPGHECQQGATTFSGDIDDVDFDDLISMDKPQDTDQDNLTVYGAVTPSRPSGNDAATFQAQRLPNGNWACNHKCRNKTACKHLCCREGVEKVRKTSHANKSSDVWKDAGVSPEKSSQSTLPGYMPQLKGKSSSSRCLGLGTSVSHETVVAAAMRTANMSPEAHFGYTNLDGGKGSTTQFGMRQVKTKSAFLADSSSPEKFSIPELDIASEDGMPPSSDSAPDLPTLPHRSLKRLHQDTDLSEATSERRNARSAYTNEGSYQSPDFDQLDDDIFDDFVVMPDLSPVENRNQAKKARIDDSLGDGTFHTARRSSNTENVVLESSGMVLQEIEPSIGVSKAKIGDEEREPLSKPGDEETMAWLKEQFGDIVDFT